MVKEDIPKKSPGPGEILFCTGIIFHHYYLIATDRWNKNQKKEAELNTSTQPLLCVRLHFNNYSCLPSYDQVYYSTIAERRSSPALH